MELEIFIDNFELMTEAPKGVQKLKEMILQLAMQGKLVPQDPKDEPASVLLENIKVDKKRSIRKGKIRKQKSIPEISQEEKPFILPEGWQWCRLGDSGIIFNGNSLNSQQKSSYSYVATGLPYIATKHVGYGTLKIDYSGEIKIPSNEPKFKIAHRNAVLICSEGGSAGRKIGMIDRDICFGNKLLANETFSGIIPKFIFYMYQSPFFSLSFKSKMTGIIGGISITNFLGLVIPLPSTAEQKRIVTKVDELMALCDDWEARKQKTHQTCIKLHDASVDKLLTAPTSAKFNHHWKRICNNFSLLYSKSENVSKLRHAILQLAVQGKLVDQDPSDKPASVLVEEIRKEREHLIKKGKIKRVKLSPNGNFNDKPYELPNGWEWLALYEFGYILGGGTPSKQITSYWEGEIPWISPKDMKTKFIENSIDHISDEALKKSSVKIIPQNSLLMVVRGMILNHSFPVAINEREVTMNQDMKALVPVITEVAPFLLLSLTGDRERYLQLVERSSHGTCRLNTGKLFNTLVALPPLQEQMRIIAVVDSLMSLCDNLESKLSQGQSDSSRLVESAVADLLAS